MKLSWISRSYHEDIVARADTARDLAMELMRQERDRANGLVEKMLAMRKDGFEPVYPDVEPVKDFLDGDIRSAINEVAEPDEESYLEAFAQEQIAAGKSPESIIESIRAGLEFQP